MTKSPFYGATVALCFGLSSTLPWHLKARGMHHHLHLMSLVHNVSSESPLARPGHKPRTSCMSSKHAILSAILASYARLFLSRYLNIIRQITFHFLKSSNPSKSGFGTGCLNLNKDGTYNQSPLVFQTVRCFAPNPSLS